MPEQSGDFEPVNSDCARGLHQFPIPEFVAQGLTENVCRDCGEQAQVGIPLVVCCTAWQRAGHYTWLPGMRGKTRDAVGPWKHLDSKALHPSRYGDDPTGEAWLTWEDGWTALGIEDRTVDSRPGSHATFAMEGEYGFTEAHAYARYHFPEVVARIEQRAPIRLVKPEAVVSGSSDHPNKEPQP